MSGLPVVYGPTVKGVAEGALVIRESGSTHSNLDELALINKDLEVISSALGEYLSAEGGFKTVAVVGFAYEVLLI